MRKLAERLRLPSTIPAVMLVTLATLELGAASVTVPTFAIGQGPWYNDELTASFKAAWERSPRRLPDVRANEVRRVGGARPLHPLVCHTAQYNARDCVLCSALSLPVALGCSSVGVLVGKGEACE